MTLVQWIVLALQASVALLVFALGLEAHYRDAAYVFQRPWLLLRSLFSMSVVMPLFAIAAVALFDLSPAINVAIVALSLSPVPPILPWKQTKAGGSAPYAVGLLFSAAVLAIFLLPTVVELDGLLFGREAHLPMAKIAPIMLGTIILPLIAGMTVNALKPEFALRFARPVAMLATALLVLAALPVLVGEWRQLLAMVGNGTLIVLALFALVGITAGHLLGGPDPDDRTVLALATAARHPGVAIAIATLNAPAEKGVLAVILWHLIVGAIVAIPYVRWRERSHARALVEPHHE